MIKTLQIRFVKTAMIAITVLLLAMICAISGIYTFRTYIDVKEAADMLADNRGLPEMGEMGFGGAGPGGMNSGEMGDVGSGMVEMNGQESEGSGTVPGAESGEMNGAQGKQGFFRDYKRLSPDDAMSKRYFLVVYSEDGEVESTDTSRIYSVSEEDAQEMTKEILDSGRQSGLSDRFFYWVRAKDDKTTVVFLDISSEISSVLSVIVISFGIAAAGWCLMLLLVIMLSRKAITPIAENIVRQKQFVTNAGHELKTPLAIIMANTEALELFNGESKWTRNIKDQTKRLNGLMQNLLTLSKMDEADLKLPMEDVDLGALLKESAAPFEEPARKKNIRFEVASEDLTVHANRDSMGQLLGILLDNAVKYTPENGKIEMSARREGKHAVIEQKNSINPEEVVEDPARLFERFYRQDSARTRKKGGYGIGLSAARAIAQANRAEISAAYSGQETIVFTVILML